MSPEEQTLAQSEPEAAPEAAQEPEVAILEEETKDNLFFTTEAPSSNEVLEAGGTVALWQHAYEAMRKDVRSWGMWSLGLGALHVIGSGFLSAGWGVLLVIVGSGSFLFQDAAMYVVYATTLAWAAISNLIGGSGGWIAMSILQVYFAYKVARSYVTYRKIQTGYTELVEAGEIPEPSGLNRARDFFPWMGIALGLFSFLGLLFLFLSLFVLALSELETAQTSQVSNWFVFVFDFDLNLAILAVAINLSALISRHPRKILPILGLIAGGLVIIVDLGLMFLG